MAVSRSDILHAQDHAWTAISQPGTWWSRSGACGDCGPETRHAEIRTCALCAARTKALSPGMVGGDHASSRSLPGAVVEAIYRIRADSGRLGESWSPAAVGG